MLGAKPYHGTHVTRTRTAASHNPSRRERRHLLVSARVIPGTKRSAQSLPCVRMATATEPLPREVMVKRAKGSNRFYLTQNRRSRRVLGASAANAAEAK